MNSVLLCWRFSSTTEGKVNSSIEIFFGRPSAWYKNQRLSKSLLLYTICLILKTSPKVSFSHFMHNTSKLTAYAYSSPTSIKKGTIFFSECLRTLLDAYIYLMHQTINTKWETFNFHIHITNKWNNFRNNINFTNNREDVAIIFILKGLSFIFI